jgi:hypothetical protein
MSCLTISCTCIYWVMGQGYNHHGTTSVRAGWVLAGLSTPKTCCNSSQCRQAPTPKPCSTNFLRQLQSVSSIAVHKVDEPWTTREQWRACRATLRSRSIQSTTQTICTTAHTFLNLRLQFRQQAHEFSTQSNGGSARSPHSLNPGPPPIAPEARRLC